MEGEGVVYQLKVTYDRKSVTCANCVMFGHQEGSCLVAMEEIITLDPVVVDVSTETQA